MELKFSKKALKKSLSVVLAIMILVSCMSQGLSAFAAYYPSYNKVKITDGNYATSGKCGDNLTWQVDEIKTFVEDTNSYYGGYYQYNYTLTISGTGAMYDYYGDDWHFENDTRPWKNYKFNITKIVVEDGVASIGEYAFYDMQKDFDISISDSVKFIAAYAFGNCYNLRSINIPNSVKLIGDSAFYSCDYLTNVTIPNSVVSIGDGAFSYCTNLNNVIIPESVITIGDGAFTECRSLTNLTISNGVSTIGGSAFSGCNSLANVTIPNSVKSIGNSAFSGCTGLENITIGNSVKSIGENAFSGCTSLTNITIPDSVVKIGRYTFDGCNSLKTVTLGKNLQYMDMYYNNDVGSSGEYGYIFNNCTNLEGIIVDEQNQYYSSDEYGVLFNKDKTNLYVYPNANVRSSYSIPDTVTQVARSAFANAKNLTNIYIPDSVIDLGYNSSWWYSEDGYVFQNCLNLKSISIPSGVKNIYMYSFDGCTSLESITIPNTVKTIEEYAFKDCVELSDVYYNDSEEIWNKIDIDSHNEWLLIASKHFANKHTHAFIYNSYGEIIDEPPQYDCSYELYCICGEIIIEYTHTWSEWYENSCGIEYRRCKNCGENEYRNTENVEHNWCDWYYSSGTCGETITQRRYCYNCDTYETQEIKTIDHSFGDWKFYSGTCGKTGREYRTCMYCEKHEYRDTDVIQHNYRESTYEPTCTNDGKYVKYCPNCGDRTETSIPATGHDYTTYTISVVSCETDGVILSVCSVCEDIEIESTPKTGHNYVNGVCVNCTGNTSGGNTPPTCTNHSYTWETLVEASCTKEGVCLGTCSVCQNLAVDYHDATGHNMVNGACENCDYTENVENEDNNNNENDNDVIDPSDDCSCNCHKSGISNFFFKLALFFQRLFGSNKECACGVAHY